MPILNPDFDPDWEARFDRAKSRVDATRDPKDLSAMHNAYWSRFRTMAEIRDFHINALKRHAEVSGLEVTIPYIDDDCTWEDISTVYCHIHDAITDYITRGSRLLNNHPEGLRAFFEDDSAQRFTEYYEYVGFWNIPSCCQLTIEYQENEAHVCFTLLPNAGTSPINMIEELATMLYHNQLADRYDPEEISWYTYHDFKGLWGHRGFMQAVLSWDKRYKKYTKVQWLRFASVPAAIAKTTALDGDEQPEPLVRPRQIAAATDNARESSSDEE